MHRLDDALHTLITHTLSHTHSLGLRRLVGGQQTKGGQQDGFKTPCGSTHCPEAGVHPMHRHHPFTKSSQGEKGEKETRTWQSAVNILHLSLLELAPSAASFTLLKSSHNWLTTSIVLSGRATRPWGLDRDLF
jgi:hypothetical protein